MNKWEIHLGTQELFCFYVFLDQKPSWRNKSTYRSFTEFANGTTGALVGVIRNDSASVPGKAVVFGSSWVKQGELTGSYTKHDLTYDKSNPKKALEAIYPCQTHREELFYTDSDNCCLLLENHFRSTLTDASWEGDTENIN